MACLFFYCIEHKYFLKCMYSMLIKDLPEQWGIGIRAMRRFLLLLVLCLSVSLLNGCQDNLYKSGVEVTVEGGGQFPAFLVGRWVADTGGWEFVFDSEGKITSAVVSIGRVKLTPGRTTTVPMEMGGKGTFKPGLWTVHYLPEQRQLIVEIAIESFRVELADNVVKGRTRDFFIGQVTSDGTQWWTQRFSYPEYIVDTAKFPNYKLPTDPNENPRENILFQKAPEQQ